MTPAWPTLPELLERAGLSKKEARKMLEAAERVSTAGLDAILEASAQEKDQATATIAGICLLSRSVLEAISQSDPHLFRKS